MTVSPFEIVWSEAFVVGNCIDGGQGGAMVIAVRGEEGQAGCLLAAELLKFPWRGKVIC